MIPFTMTREKATIAAQTMLNPALGLTRAGWRALMTGLTLACVRGETETTLRLDPASGFLVIGSEKRSSYHGLDGNRIR